MLDDMEWPHKMLQYLLYFHINSKNHITFYFLFHAKYWIFSYQWIRENKKILNWILWKMKKWVYIFQIYGKFWNVSLGNFFKHKLLIECLHAKCKETYLDGEEFCNETFSKNPTIMQFCKLDSEQKYSSSFLSLIFEYFEPHGSPNQ